MKNLIKHIGFTILLCLVFIVIPNNTYACAKKATGTEKKCCLQKTSVKTEEKSCCKTKKCKKDKSLSDCNGTCSDSSCKCGTGTSLSLFGVPVRSYFITKDHFADTEKQNFDFKNTYYSSGYFSIWQPPKIG